jgi:molybdopterin synthase catalytic subunit
MKTNILTTQEKSKLISSELIKKGIEHSYQKIGNNTKIIVYHSIDDLKIVDDILKIVEK